MKAIIEKGFVTKTKIMNAIYVLVALTTVYIMTNPVLCASSKKLETAAKESAEGIQSIVQGATKWILMIVIVGIGLTLLIGSSRKKEEVKDKIPSIIGGVICILAAGGLATTIFGWFG